MTWREIYRQVLTAKDPAFAQMHEDLQEALMFILAEKNGIELDAEAPKDTDTC